MGGSAETSARVTVTCRSGITSQAALALGLDRAAASRFSFWMAIPIIVLSGGYKMLQLTQVEHVPWFDIALGTVLSAIAAYLCIHLFLTWINRIGMLPFVIYRLLLGTVLIAILMNT